jgi:transposase
VQFLSLLKSQQAETLQQAAVLLGRHRLTIQNWARHYRQGGMSVSPSHRLYPGGQSALPAWAEIKLR